MTQSRRAQHKAVSAAALVNRRPATQVHSGRVVRLRLVQYGRCLYMFIHKCRCSIERCGVSAANGKYYL